MEEYISKRQAIEAVGHCDNRKPEKSEVFYKSLEVRVSAIKSIEKIKPADVSPVIHAKWENLGNEHHGPNCSNCKTGAYEDAFGGGWILTDFCPHCGAKMDGGE